MSRRSAPARPDTGDADECEPGLPEPLGDHPLAQRLGRELVPVVGGQLFAGQRGAEVGIVGADQSQHLLANGVGQGVAGASTEAA